MWATRRPAPVLGLLVLIGRLSHLGERRGILEVPALFSGVPYHRVSQVPLGDIINNMDAIAWILKWAIGLLTFEIQYQPCRAIKS